MMKPGPAALFVLCAATLGAQEIIPQRDLPVGSEWVEPSDSGFVALAASPKYLLLAGLILLWFGFANEARKLHARRNDR